MTRTCGSAGGVGGGVGGWGAPTRPPLDLNPQQGFFLSLKEMDGTQKINKNESLSIIVIIIIFLIYLRCVLMVCAVNLPHKLKDVYY